MSFLRSPYFITNLTLGATRVIEAFSDKPIVNYGQLDTNRIKTFLERRVTIHFELFGTINVVGGIQLVTTGTANSFSRKSIISFGSFFQFIHSQWIQPRE